MPERDDGPVCEAYDDVGEGGREGESGDRVRACELDFGFAEEGWWGRGGTGGGAAEVPNSEDRVGRRGVLL